jgi:hypothetical protein
MTPTRIAFGSPTSPQGGGKRICTLFNLPLAGRSILRSAAQQDRVGGKP